MKAIKISDEVYRKLLAIKGENESFSELFERLVECNSSVDALKKIRATVEFADKEAMLSELRSKKAEKRL